MKFRLPFFTFILFAQHSVAQSWQPQPVNIKTRWYSKVNPSNVLPEYPRPQLARTNWTNLNGLWDYAVTNKNENPAKWNGKILVPFPIESALSGVKKRLEPEQQLWYKRTITKPSAKAGDRVLLNFGAVDFDATVYINNREVGGHKGGYQHFTIDVTDALKSGSNELSLKVWDPSDRGPNPHGKQVLNPEGIMYTPSSGIWQTVWMEVVPSVAVESIKLVPDIDKSTINITVDLSGDESGASVKATVKDGTKVVATKTFTGTAGISIPSQKLWSPDDPFLYDLQLQVVKGGKVIDNVNSYFGMRKIDVRKDEKGIERIYLNNKYTYNLGTLDQGFWPDGLYTAPCDEALLYDIKAIKAMGFNTIRKHIKLEPDRWYYHTDKLGMLVWQDMVNPGNDTPEGRQQFEKECKENIAQLFNHPSITTWVLFNEKWGQYDQQRLTRWMKSEDPTRLVNGHSGEILYVNNKLRSPSPDAWIDADMTDVHSYPMPGYVQSKPGMARTLGEFGGIGVPVEGHLWDEFVAGWGYDGVVTPDRMKQQYTGMVDSLVVLEKEGLSASIYTQPFDVESEQNGLITYDREVIKLPVETFRSIHKKLWPSTANTEAATKGLVAQVAAAGGSRSYDEKLKEFENGNRDSAFLRTLAIMALQQKDKVNMAKVAGEYVSKLKDPYNETNLTFIKRTTTSTKDPGFKVFYDNAAKVNSILGKDESEALTTMLMEADYILPYTAKGAPDWTTITSNLVNRYSTLGEEIALQSQFLYTVNHQEWVNLGKAIDAWFPKYGINRKWISTMLINSVAWAVFENTNDKNVLKSAITMTSHAVSVDTSMPELLDTHANLLYKFGNKDEALKWQEQAAKSGKPEIVEAYEKMKKGEPTWPSK